MASDAELDSIVEKTQAELGAFVKKPKLAPNLLKKPPFRFLHDVISESHRATGVPPNLSEEELTSANYADRDSKVAYLTMILDKIGAICGRSVPAKPLKIVAGLEPENTNVMLQMLAEAIKIHGDGGGGGNTASAAKVESAPPPPPKQKEVEPEVARPQLERPTHAERAPEIRPLDGTEPPPRREGRRTRHEPEPEPEPQQQQPPQQQQQQVYQPPPPQQQQQAPAPAAAPLGKPPAAPAASSSNNDGDDEPQRTSTGRRERPKTARRGPPKIQSNVDSARPLSRVAGRESPTPAGIISDNAVDDDSDEEAQNPSTADAFASHAGATMTYATSGNTDDHGILVRNILGAEQMIEKENAAELRRVESKQQRDNRSGDKSQQQQQQPQSKTRQEIESLREAIQKICKATNPLARCMDYVHEDMDGMQKELDFWRKDKVAVAQKLEEEQRRTEHILDPLYAQLRNLEENIKEQQLKCAHTKASVLRNEQQIAGLLRGIVSR